MRRCPGDKRPLRLTRQRVVSRRETTQDGKLNDQSGSRWSCHDEEVLPEGPCYIEYDLGSAFMLDNITFCESPGLYHRCARGSGRFGPVLPLIPFRSRLLFVSVGATDWRRRVSAGEIPVGAPSGSAQQASSIRRSDPTSNTCKSTWSVCRFSTGYAASGFDVIRGRTAPYLK